MAKKVRAPLLRGKSRRPRSGRSTTWAAAAAGCDAEHERPHRRGAGRPRGAGRRDRRPLQRRGQRRRQRDDRGRREGARGSEAAGGTFVTRPADAAQQHMSDPNQRVSYETFPASSGTHNPTTSIWGNYRQPVDPRQAVHNLEHGGVVIWHGPDISAADRGALDAFYDEDENGLVITPIPDPYPGVTYPKHDQLGSKIALTVWTASETSPRMGRSTSRPFRRSTRRRSRRSGMLSAARARTVACEPAGARRQLARLAATVPPRPGSPPRDDMGGAPPVRRSPSPTGNGDSTLGGVELTPPRGITRF